MECPNCGESGFSQIGRHWSSDRCSHPSLTQKQKEITTGLLLGDGSIGRRISGNPSVQVKMITEKYLQYIDQEFGVLGLGVDKINTAKEQAELNRDSGFHTDAKEENYSDVYQWTTRRHPEFSTWEDWYSSGEKVWPHDIELTPTVLKHWYCGDGRYHNYSSDSIQIATVNEINNETKIKDMFERQGFDARVSSAWIQFTNEESDRLWRYMGDPLPGFEYKWPERFK